MSQWKFVAGAANSVNWAPNLLNTTSNTATQGNLYGNTTLGAFIPNQYTGQYEVDTAEMAAGANGILYRLLVTNPGSGYTANAVVTIGASAGVNATANATANATGRISALNVNSVGSGYTTNPSVTIAAPTAVTFNANSAVDNANDFITIASNVFQNNDYVQYLVSTGNTALTNLANSAYYYIVSANSTGVKLSLTNGGVAIDLTKGVTESGHSLTGQTAAGIAVISSSKGVQHAGWVLRKEGTGGRAGRVQWETLVAGGSMTGDGNDDLLLPDT